MISVRKWARTVSSDRSERELILELENLLLAGHPEARTSASVAAAQTAARIASRQSVAAGAPAYTMWRPNRSAPAASAYMNFGMLALLYNVAVLALPVALALKPILPFTDVVMITGICALLALPAAWLSEFFRMKADMINVPPVGVLASYTILNALSLAFILVFSATLPASVGVSSWPLWPLAIAGATLCNAVLAWRAHTNQRSLETDRARHLAEQEAIWDSRKHPIERIVASGVKRCQAALASLSPAEIEALSAERSAALDVLVSREIFSPALADALRPALPGAALIAFASVRTELNLR